MAALILTFVCLGIVAIGLFGGFTTFDASYSLFHVVCHTFGGIMLSLIVLNKSHYVFFWYVFPFFSAFPMVVELYGISSVLLLKKRRW